jgi:hypothetical protein
VRRVVKQKTGLVLSVGAARNKTLAKFASAAAKPDGVKVVTEDDELGAAGSSTKSRDSCRCRCRCRYDRYETGARILGVHLRAVALRV